MLLNQFEARKHIIVYECTVCGHKMRSMELYREKCPVCGLGEMAIVSSWRVKK